MRISTNHFNELTEAQTERLAILAEECGEVVQIIGKILRHGYDSHNPLKSRNVDDPSNRAMLERECGDVMHALDRLAESKDLWRKGIERQRAEKAEKIKRYLHHQGGSDA